MASCPAGTCLPPAAHRADKTSGGLPAWVIICLLPGGVCPNGLSVCRDSSQRPGEVGRCDVRPWPSLRGCMVQISPYPGEGCGCQNWKQRRVSNQKAAACCAEQGEAVFVERKNMGASKPLSCRCVLPRRPRPGLP